MAFLLRNINIPKWVAPDWMLPGEVPADALTDLRANDNTVSVWSVKPDQANLNLVLTALASHRERLDKLDYTLLDEAILAAIPITCVVSEATTPCLSANATHRDLVELTVKKVARLAEEIMPLQRRRVSETNVKHLLADALAKGLLDRARLKPRLLAQLDPRTT